MPLFPGTKLGPYEIVSLLGSGGMGEVYRAKDARLNRDVAIKVLSESWHQDATFLARFEREAKVLASLNHPNIVSLFEFGEVDGRAYAVMELLQGRTLRQALADGPMPLRQAAEIGAAVAHGLAAAHRAGIIHRDLKPENIFLADQGAVKLLDFGLAKKVIRRSSGAGEEEAGVHPTSTNAGVLLGTVGYMAPEQLQSDGLVDGRSDLFALGCVLYEMVAGSKAFASETPMGTLHAILTQDPDFDHPLFPSSLREVLRHCLAKPPEQRFQDAQDLAYALEALRHPVSGAVQAPVEARPRRWKIAAAAAGLLLLLGGLAAWRWRGQSRLPVFTPMSPREGQVYAARFDGSGQALFALRVGDAPSVVAQSQSNGAAGPSMDAFRGLIPLHREASGAWLLLRGSRRLEGNREIVEGDLVRMRPEGGQPEVLADGVTGADESSDGLVAAIRRVDGHCQLEAPLGTVRMESNGWMDSLRVEPSGRWIAFADHRASPPSNTLSILDLKDGSMRSLGSSWRSLRGLAWTSSGELWFTASKAGEAQALYAGSLAGRIRPLLSAPESLVIEDVSDSGALLLETRVRSGILARAPTGDPGPVDSESPDLLGLSADGRWLAFAVNGSEVRLARLDAPSSTPLGAADLAAPSPDGSKVALAARDGSGWRLMLWENGSSTPLPKLDFSLIRQVAWTPAGDALLVGGSLGAGGYRVWRLSLDGKDLRPICPEGISQDQPFLLAPDGQTLVVQSGPLITRFNLADPAALPLSLPGVSPGERLIGWGKDTGHLLVLGPRLPTEAASIDLKDGSRQPAFPLAFYGFPGALIDTAFSTGGGEAYAIGCRETQSRLFLVSGLR